MDKVAGYQEVTIYGIKQRWLLIESKHALARELQTFQRRLDKKSTQLLAFGESSV